MEKIKIPTITELSQGVKEDWVPYWISNLPTLVAAMVITAVIYCSYKLWRGWKLKKRQNAVDQTIDELVDRKKTSCPLFLQQLMAIGIINDQENLVLKNKYGPGIASDIAMAKIVTRLMLDQLIPSQGLAKAIVDHFMTDHSRSFEKRYGYLEAFRLQVKACFSDRKVEELIERDLLSAAIAQKLSYYLREEDSRLDYLAKEKERKWSKRKDRAFGLAYGLEKTFGQKFAAASWARVLNLGHHLKRADSIKTDPAKAESFPQP